jgi:hypothetical protein
LNRVSNIAIIPQNKYAEMPYRFSATKFQAHLPLNGEQAKRRESKKSHMRAGRE